VQAPQAFRWVLRRSAVLLVAWVAAFAILRGVRDIVAAFRVRELQHPKPAG
jgi:uncharacterized membrane protein HdeD (DUF308 family)